VTSVVVGCLVSGSGGEETGKDLCLGRREAEGSGERCRVAKLRPGDENRSRRGWLEPRAQLAVVHGENVGKLRRFVELGEADGKPCLADLRLVARRKLDSGRQLLV